MITVIILVEGFTEELFVKRVLAPYLIPYGIYLIPKVIVTKINKGGANFKGGIDSYIKIKNDLCRILVDKSVFVSTLIDLYALPNDFPNYVVNKAIKDPYKKIKKIEQDFYNEISNDRFIPHLQLHEFEALLFSEIDGFGRFYSETPKIMDGLRKVFTSFPNPEFINDTPENAPSKRILKIIPHYRKHLMGPSIAEKIGIDVILDKCPHFSSWVDKLKSLNP